MINAESILKLKKKKNTKKKHKNKKNKTKPIGHTNVSLGYAWQLYHSGHHSRLPVTQENRIENLEETKRTNQKK